MSSGGALKHPQDKPKMMAERAVLVIDDEDVICQVVTGLLEDKGWATESANDISTALDKSRERVFPVILCDVHLKGDTYEFLRTVKELRPLTQVIMFTGDATVHSAREAVKFGAYDYLLKPLNKDELCHTVALAYDHYNLLADRQQLQEENARYRHDLAELADKRTEQLRESELRYRSIFDRAADAIFLVDVATGEICECNVAAARMVSTEAASLNGRKIQDFVKDQLALCFVESMNPGHAEWRIQRVSLSSESAPTKIAQVFASKVELGDRIYLQIVARDISDLVELMERAELMELELMSEQRLATIGLLASGVAHNINTPLMGIYGLAQIIKMKHPDIEDVDTVLTQVERINGIIRNLMWKSRQEQDGAVQEIDINVLLQEELKFLDADMEFKHDVDKDISFADNVPPILGRYSDFSQSFMNILRNALDSMHDRQDKRIEIKTTVQDGDICITVKDSGCGIAAEDREKIFKPFYTTKPAASQNGDVGPTGTGLGLSTVQKLLSRYNCSYDVISRVNFGTTFMIRIPISSNMAEMTSQSEM